MKLVVSSFTEVDLTRKSLLSQQTFLPPNRSRKKRVIFITIIVLLLLVGGAFFYAQSRLTPVDRNSNKKVNVTIPQGSSVQSIGTVLKKKI